LGCGAEGALVAMENLVELQHADLWTPSAAVAVANTTDSPLRA